MSDASPAPTAVGSRPEAFAPTERDDAPSRYTQRAMPDSTTVVSTEVDLPPGWNRTRVRVDFVLPVAYPSAQPDCFFTDHDLLLASGARPSNTGDQVLDGQIRLWFSWHLTHWSPSTGNVTTYIRFIESRLRDVR